jgi:hypothetical protein
MMMQTVHVSLKNRSKLKTETGKKQHHFAKAVVG